MKINLFVLGVQKCGTTTLAELLGAHPSIYCPPNKETYFFCDEALYAKGEDWYLEEYYSTAAARTAHWRVDATPFYLASDKALERIAQYADPSARFLVILRDPAERALSAHAHQVRLGREELSFDEALSAEAGRVAAEKASGGRWWRQAYATVGRYGEQLERAFALLGRERILVLQQKDLRDLPRLEAELVRFLDLDEGFPERKALHANPASMPRSRLLSGAFTSDNPVKRLARRLFPREVRARLGWAIYKLILKPAPKPEMSAELRARLAGDFADDQARLAALLASSTPAD